MSYVAVKIGKIFAGLLLCLGLSVYECVRHWRRRNNRPKTALLIDAGFDFLVVALAAMIVLQIASGGLSAVRQPTWPFLIAAVLLTLITIVDLKSMLYRHFRV